jgi:hypothetical protein
MMEGSEGENMTDSNREMTKAQSEILKAYRAAAPNFLHETYTREIERAYYMGMEADFSHCDARLVADAVSRLADGSEYHGKTVEEIRASYEKWIVDVTDDEWTPDADEVRLVRAWLDADPFVHFLYGYVVTEAVTDAARDYAVFIVTREDAPDFNKVVDGVADKFLAFFKKAVS